MEELIEIAKRFEIKVYKNHLLSLEEIKSFLKKSDSKDSRKFLLKLNIEYDLAYDLLYIGKYDEVADETKELFLIMSFLKAFGILTSKSDSLKELTEAIRILDVAIMVACGLKHIEFMTEFTQKLHDYTIIQFPIPKIEEKLFNNSSSLNSDIDTSCDIDTFEQPSMEHFWTRYYHLYQPVKLKSCMTHWPAMTKWTDANYFIKIAGYRNCPIELGQKYDDDNWSQSLFKLKDFLNIKQQSTKAYLAQHDLFEQIPFLKNDICIPDYCAISSEEPIIKSWIGPENTISTMHTDDKHNILCQVIGAKLIILAEPKETENLYAYEGILSNTTKIDAENLDFKKFPLVRNVKFLRLVLKPGEMLYIPKSWWHYVRSLTPSVSVSFWFNAE